MRARFMPAAQPTAVAATLPVMPRAWSSLPCHCPFRHSLVETLAQMIKKSYLHWTQGKRQIAKIASRCQEASRLPAKPCPFPPPAEPSPFFHFSKPAESSLRAARAPHQSPTPAPRPPHSGAPARQSAARPRPSHAAAPPPQGAAAFAQHLHSILQYFA